MQTLITLVTLVVCAAVAVGGMYVADKAPVHSNLGGWSDILLPLAVTMGVMIVVVAALGLGAWALWRADHKMAAQLLGVTAVISGILVWVLGDALNVLLDDSAPEQHETTMIRSVGATAKRSGYFVLASWRVPDEEISVDLPTRGQVFAHGTRLIVTIRAGAFGRPYAIALEPAEPAAQ
jgi:cytochrome bd-type quinol oxidase subunit 2